MMDKETLLALAEATAKVTAVELAAELRKDMKEQFAEAKAELKQELTRELRAYFGTVPPDQHIIQHERLDRLIKFTDRISEGFWGRVVMGLIVMALLGIGLASIVGLKFGFHP